MPPFFSDTFTETINTDLATHVPNVGTSWTQLWVAGTRFYQVVSTGAGIRSNGNSGDSGFMYTADATYPSANYEIQFTLVATVTSIVPVYVFVRIQDQENMYAVRLIPGTGTCSLYKKVSGTWSTIGSAFNAPANGSICKLIINGSSISFEDDGVQVATATDGDISAAGKGGVGMGGGAELVVSTDDVSATIVIDTFSITDLGGVSSIVHPVMATEELLGVMFGGQVVR